MNICLIFQKRENVPLFDLEISQEEDFFAKARLLVEAGIPLPPCGTIGIIQGDELYFQGVLVGDPVKIEGKFAEIELIACPPDVSERIAIIQKDIHIPPYWDALWVKDSDKYEEIQDAHTSSLYCDRRSWELARSDWFEGRQTLSVQGAFFQDSLRFRVIKNPFKTCTVKVHAHWIQKEEGISDLSAAIRLSFPHSKVNTYTKEALLEKWPSPGRRVGRSGVWILKSELKEMTPASPFYPAYSAPLSLREEGENPRSYHVKRHWFKPTLWVNWTYHQKRKETLVVTLHHAFQDLYPGDGEHKVVEFTLQNINPDPNAYTWRPDCFYREGTKVSYKNAIYRCHTTHTAGLLFEEDKWAFQNSFHTDLGNPARASFFLTDRGYQAAEHAMERAKATLAKSARAIEISFEAPWEVVKDMTTDTTVILNDSRLPGGEGRGKVVKYSLIAKGETGERFGRVTLLCAPNCHPELVSGTRGYQIPNDPGSSPGLKLRDDSSVPNDYCEESYQVHENAMRQTPSGLSYFRYDDTVPLQVRREGHLLKGIELINGPEDQEEEMLAYAGRSTGALEKALSHKSTRLRLHFKDLRTKETIEHLIPVRMAAPWSAPHN
ncbi:MAG: hypothetical protein HYX35_06150 [Proteobacteria bacterium]|nr:hypothetical protein [Pseudomonadota bacterium]